MLTTKRGTRLDGASVRISCGRGIDERRVIGALEPSVSTLVEKAREGDEQAWVALVDRFSGLVWWVTRGFRLSEDDAADVFQTTWLRLVEHLDDIRQPERIGGWLASTARRLCLLRLQKAGRDVPTEFEDHQLVSADETVDLDAALDAQQERSALRRALDDLPEPRRALLRVLSTDPAPTYAEVAAALDMPIGSIGPTRARCLDRLRRSPHLLTRQGTDTAVAC